MSNVTNHKPRLFFNIVYTSLLFFPMAILQIYLATLPEWWSGLRDTSCSAYIGLPFQGNGILIMNIGICIIGAGFIVIHFLHYFRYLTAANIIRFILAICMMYFAVTNLMIGTGLILIADRCQEYALVIFISGLFLMGYMAMSISKAALCIDH